MSIESIQFTLRERFAAPLPEFYQRRIIFWQDEDREFESMLDELYIPDVTILKLTGTNNFAVKKLLLHDDLTGNYLIYNPFSYADPKDNWLLDIEKFSEEYRSDLISTRMNELNIEASPAMRKTVKLYAKFFGVSNTQANAEIFSIVCRHETPRIAPTPIASPKELPKEASRADAQAIDQTFRTLLAMLPLAESHRSDLYRRGLNDDQIEQYLYRSVPAFGYRALTGQLLQMGCHLEGVPGFYQDEQKDWTLACSPRRTGYFVPVISVDGLLQGCQIRMDHPGKQGGKYIWLSSAERNGGVTSGSPVHFVGDPAADTVWITEGPLKATVAHCLSGHSFLAVAGANQLNGLPDSLSLLKRFGCRTVCEAFDMDKLQNPHVANGTAKVLELAKNMGFSVRQIRWNPQYKGIDDYLLSKQKNV